MADEIGNKRFPNLMPRQFEWVKLFYVFTWSILEFFMNSCTNSLPDPDCMILPTKKGENRKTGSSCLLTVKKKKERPHRQTPHCDPFTVLWVW